MKWTEEQYQAHLKNRPTLSVARLKAVPKKKYKNKVTYVNCIRFDSQLEGDYYKHLRDLWNVGVVSWFTRQVPFQLPGGVVARLDFQVMYTPKYPHYATLTNGFRIEDCKGVMTQSSINKFKQIKEIYGLDVHIVTKGMFK